MADTSPEGTFRYLLDQKRSAYWMRGPLGQPWWGLLCGLIFDEAAEAWSLCVRMALLADPESPDDILPVIARERRLDRYYLETPAQHRARLLDAWGIYPFGGTEYVIETQLRAAGFGPTALIGTWGAAGHTWGESGHTWADLGAFVQYRPAASGPRGEPAPYRTQFWVVFASGFHPVANDMIPWGSFEWGDHEDGVWSYFGYTDDFVRTVLGLILKWKPSTYVLRGLVFRTGSITSWGESGHTWAEASAEWGGAVEVEIPLGVTAPT